MCCTSCSTVVPVVVPSSTRSRQGKQPLLLACRWFSISAVLCVRLTVQLAQDVLLHVPHHGRLPQVVQAQEVEAWRGAG